MQTQRFELNKGVLETAQEDGYLISVKESGSQIVKVGDFLSIGRDSINQLELADPFVSSRHCRIEKTPTGYRLRDLQSQNGTYVNDNRMIEGFIKSGDRIRIGNREFLFQLGEPEIVESNLLKSKNSKWHQQLSGLPQYSRTDLPVMLLGPSGSGKEVLARLVHDHSNRSRRPFVSVNCSALSENLIESELFGHIRGSFTGATHDRKGAFESARGGTLFLDEIGDLPLTLQPKLLRALENKEIRPLGSDKTIKTDVRIIAATHKDLAQQIQINQFRSDLYYRLNVIKIDVPSLKERMEDFEILLMGFAREMKVSFSMAAIETLKKHQWPGNIRELKNVVSRASALFPNQSILTEHVRHLVDPTSNTITNNFVFPQRESARVALREIERDLIIEKLKENKGNQRKTAKDLGIPKSTLHDRVRAFGIDPKIYVS